MPIFAYICIYCVYIVPILCLYLPRVPILCLYLPILNLPIFPYICILCAYICLECPYLPMFNVPILCLCYVHAYIMPMLYYAYIMPMLCLCYVLPIRIYLVIKKFASYTRFTTQRCIHVDTKS